MLLTGFGTLDDSAASAASFIVHEGQASTFNGIFADGGTGALSLVKQGTATLTITGASTYTGSTTISAGTLLVDNTSGQGTGSGTVTVAAGAALGGKGTVGDVNAMGDIRPGDDAVSSTTSASSLSSGTLFLDIASATSFDSVVDATTLRTSPSTRRHNVGSNVSTTNSGNAFKILSVPGTLASALVGSFTNLPTSGSTLTVGGQQFQINYAGGAATATSC